MHVVWVDFIFIPSECLHLYPFCTAWPICMMCICLTLVPRAVDDDGMGLPCGLAALYSWCPCHSRVTHIRPLKSMYPCPLHEAHAQRFGLDDHWTCHSGANGTAKQEKGFGWEDGEPVTDAASHGVICPRQALSKLAGCTPVDAEEQGRVLANCAAAKLQLSQPASALESCQRALKVGWVCHAVGAAVAVSGKSPRVLKRSGQACLGLVWDRRLPPSIACLAWLTAP